MAPTSFYASPVEALQAPPEELLYLACLHEGTGVDAPDFLAVVDAEYGRIVHETPMPNVGDELHHFGWNRCSSACHGPDRSHLIVPGFRSSRIHVLNVADDPRAPRIEKVIEPQELTEATGYTRPHTVHCMPGDNIVISMLGDRDRDGGGAGGFAVLDARTFEVKGRWENGGERPPMNYDFWYQPRKNVLISSEFGEPNAYEEGSTSPMSAPAATGGGCTSGTSPSGGSKDDGISYWRQAAASAAAGGRAGGGGSARAPGADHPTEGDRRWLVASTAARSARPSPPRAAALTVSASNRPRAPCSPPTAGGRWIRVRATNGLSRYSLLISGG